MIGAQINLNCIGGTVDNVGALGLAMRAIGGNGNLAEDDANLLMGGSVDVFRRTRNNDDPVNGWVAASLPGVVNQFQNEPGVDAASAPAFVARTLDYLTNMHARNLRAGVGVFAVGNPHESLIQGGAFDDMLTALNPDDALILHEYFYQDPLAPSENGYLCFRCEWWLKQMVKLGTRCRRLIIGEYGRDYQGGMNDGWRGQGWSADYYAALLIKGMGEYLRLAQTYGFIIDVDVFCGGHGYGNRWQSFNVEGEIAIYTALMQWNEENPLMTTYPASTNPAQMSVDATNGLRIHSAPSINAPIIGLLSYQQVVTAYTVPNPTADGKRWMRIDDPTGERWVANQYLTPVVTDNGDVTLTLADLQALAANNTEISQRAVANDAILQRLKGGGSSSAGGF